MQKFKMAASAGAFTIALAGILSLSGCATAQPVITPNGTQGFAVNCSITNDMGECFQKAGELCGDNGYTVVSKHNNSAGFFEASDKTMIIQCKP